MLDRFRREIEKHRQRPFLEAVMACCALVATADGEISFSERSRMDWMVEDLEQLKLFDPHNAVTLFNRYADWLFSAPEAARASTLRTVRLGADAADAGTLLVRIAVAMAEADGEYTSDEQAVVRMICANLGLDPALAEAGSHDT